MSALETILGKLESQDQKLVRIEEAVVQIAVQDNMIANLQNQVDVLFRHNEELKKEVAATQLAMNKELAKTSEKTVPVKNLVAQVRLIWGAFVVTAIGILFKSLS